ncbi:MAG: DUF4056 domain-containing protein [Anaerohalosphaera sp.]|nr:DUF4056 domain-containing protein [Anaerohalosphaera sp.]
MITIPQLVFRRRSELRAIYARLAIVLLIPTFALFQGCNTANPKPRLRGAYFGAPNGIAFPAPDKMGSHQRSGNFLTEKNGMVYTCNAGFIDIGHLREAADRTAYISKVVFDDLMEQKQEVTLQMIEPSRFVLTIRYPDNWETLSPEDKKNIAEDLSINLGQYLAQTTTIWHEIITWFGYSTLGIFPEYISSFSWEDTYSDLLGTCLAVEALKDTDHTFDEAMTALIDQEFKRLNVQPSSVAKQAVKAVKGDWYTGLFYFDVRMKKRNFDVGLDDGLLTPWLVPGICDESQPTPCPAPNLDFLEDSGFEVDLEIQPRVFEARKIYSIIYENGKGKNVRPAQHFPVIMKFIIEDAIERFGPEVDQPIL